MIHTTQHLIKAALFSAITLGSSAAFADSISWSFDLPATGLASLEPPYPSVATLTMTDVTGGVQFVLDPNGDSPGAKGTGGIETFVKQLQFVYSGDLTGALSPIDVSGPSIESISVGNTANMDTGYSSSAKYIMVDYFDNAPNPANPIDNRFNFTQTSTWTLTGLTLANITSAFATSEGKTSPIFGIISVAPYECSTCKPDPSNWVTGPSAVPIPAAAWLFGSGLMGLASLAKRRKA